MLRQALVKLAHDMPPLRKHLVPLLQKTAGLDNETDLKAWKKEMAKPISSHADLVKELDGTSDTQPFFRATDWVNDMNGSRDTIRWDLKELGHARPFTEEWAALLTKATAAKLRNLLGIKSQYRTPEEKQTFAAIVKRMKMIDAMVNDWAEKSIQYHKSH